MKREYYKSNLKAYNAQCQIVEMGRFICKVLKFFATAFILSISESSTFTNTNQDFVLENYALLGSSYTRIQSQTLSTCTEVCLQDKRCFSINFSPSSGCCELNGQVWSSSNYFGSNLVFSLGCIYRRLKSSHDIKKV